MENNKIDVSIYLKDIIEAIKQVQYGEVIITIHNSKIVQIEKRDKKRI